MGWIPDPDPLDSSGHQNMNAPSELPGGLRDLSKLNGALYKAWAMFYILALSLLGRTLGVLVLNINQLRARQMECENAFEIKQHQDGQCNLLI